MFFFFFREKMAFFTRVNSNVPFLPSDECHEVMKKDGGGSSNGDGEQAGRFEYVIDRVLGVEV